MVAPSDTVTVVVVSEDAGWNDARVALSNVRVMVEPPVGAGAERVIVPVDAGGLDRPDGSPPGIEAGFIVRFEMRGNDSRNRRRNPSRRKDIGP